MAYMSKGKAGTWEIRESAATDRGPRSRTLATFKELGDEAIAKAIARSNRELNPTELRNEAIRKGIPVAASPVTRSARELLGGMAQGGTLPPGLASALAGSLRDAGHEPSDAGRSAAEWVNASPSERAAALHDLLLLADQIPTRRRQPSLAFPRLRTVGA